MFHRELDMPHFSTLLMFALGALGMVLTPGPNMIWIGSRLMDLKDVLMRRQTVTST